jgi:ribonuclease D
MPVGVAWVGSGSFATNRLAYRIVTTESELNAVCHRLKKAETIAFDTEFVSEHTYRPQLCLVQVAMPGELVIIDTQAVPEITAFWEVLAEPTHETIVHAGRQELVFCLEAIGRPPARLFDVQLAAGMVGLEYPAGYGNLIFRMLGEKPQKGETRTDWRRRPLTDRQLEYALDDVRHLARLREVLGQKLDKLGRTAWYETEMTAWQDDVAESRLAERWRKVAGSSALGGRSLAIVRQLWLWREREAERRNSPVKQVLRDDLIVELAKRRSDDPKQISAIRGMERGDLRRLVPDLSRVIGKALAAEEEHLPANVRTESSPQLMMLGQLLSSALSSICRDAHIAASLVGTATDVRELAAYRLGEYPAGAEPPLLCRGWRAEVVGQLLDDLLAGKVSIRIGDPRSEQPLVFDRQ